MYFQKDYILRMIEMVGKLFERILANHNDSQAMQELDEIAQKACGLQISMLRGISPEELQGPLAEAQRYFAAELLTIEMEVKKRTMTDDMLLPRRIQILSIYASLKEMDYLLRACDNAAHLTDGYLDQLPPPLLVDLSVLFERGGQYGHAEDMLYAAMAQAGQVKPQIATFYARLATLSDGALLAGGLPRAEIEEGQKALNV